MQAGQSGRDSDNYVVCAGSTSHRLRSQSQCLATVFTDRCDSETALFIQQLSGAKILPIQILPI